MRRRTPPTSAAGICRPQATPVSPLWPGGGVGVERDCAMLFCSHPGDTSLMGRPIAVTDFRWLALATSVHTGLSRVAYTTPGRFSADRKDPGPTKRGLLSPRLGFERGPAPIHELEGSEAFQWPVDEEHLQGDVGFDVGLAHERHHLAVSQLLDRLGIARGHHPLELVAH